MIEQIKDIVGENNIQQNYSLKNCCSIKVGGNAKYFVTPESVDALFGLIDFLEKEGTRFRVIGNGTNIVFNDNGFNGVIISTKKLDTIILYGEDGLLVSAGTMLSKVMNVSVDNNLSGLEFTAGIPGTVGGAIVMNAGASGFSVSDIVKNVTIYCNGDIKTIDTSECKFGYRTSRFLVDKSAVIIYAELKLKKELSNEKIKETIKSNLLKRRATQPTEPSAGCVFKKCGDLPAGYLIDHAGLKGTAIGGAQISNVHANFIVNTGGASCENIKNLIELIETKIYDEYSLELQKEIEII